MQRISDRIDQLVTDYSKLLVIRLDFSLLKEHADSVDQSYMVNAFAQFRNNSRNNSLFDNLITYINKLEYGIDKKWHFHTMFFFNGQYVNHDIWLSQKIGEYWVNVITKNMGMYYSANCHHEQYHQNGIGMIQHHDTQKIQYCKAAAYYLAKEDPNIIAMNLVDATGKQIRLFNMGQYKPKNNNLGRPRMDVNQIIWNGGFES